MLATREGDLTLAQAKSEIAKKLLLEREAAALGEKDVASFIARAKAGEKPSDIFTTDDDGKPADKKDADKKDADKKDDKKAAGKDDKKAAEKKDDKKEKVAAKPQKSSKRLLTTDFFQRSAQGLIPRIGISKSLMDRRLQAQNR